MLNEQQINFFKRQHESKSRYFEKLGELWKNFFNALANDNGETGTALDCMPRYSIVNIKDLGKHQLSEKTLLAQQQFNKELAEVFSNDDIQNFWENPHDYSYAIYGEGDVRDTNHLGKVYNKYKKEKGHGMYVGNGRSGYPTLFNSYEDILDAISYERNGISYHEQEEVELEERKKNESQEIEREKREAAEIAAEKNYYQMVLDSQKGVPPEITDEKVRKGIEFIIKHRDMPQEELVKKLIAMGCNWVNPDVVEKFGTGIGEIKTCPTKFGANIIAQIFYGSKLRKYAEYCFIDECGETASGLAYWLEINKDNEKKKSSVEHGMSSNKRGSVDVEKRKKDESQEIERKKREAAERAAEKNYYQMVLDSQKGVPPEITDEKVRKGREFIINHRDMPQEELVKNLIDMGCNWLKPDVVKKFGQGEGEIKTGDTKSGANIIAQIFYGSKSREDVERRFIDDCDKTDPGIEEWFEDYYFLENGEYPF